MTQLKNVNRYYIATMGCQMNEYDSDYLSRLIEADGYLSSDSPENANLIIINTCSVREKAEQKAFSLLGRMIKLKNKKPEIILGFTGCIAQQEGQRLLKRFPELNFVIGTRETCKINESLARIKNQNERIALTDLTLKPIYNFINSEKYFKGRVKSHISIMEGCNNFCSYCIVPYVRGREVSRPPEEIIREAKSLIRQGVKEITLLGQNVNSYSSGKGSNVTFSDLLKMLGDIEGLYRIRFTTSHPKDLSGDLIESFVKIKKLCSHIHLPFQSGSDRVLKLMHRKYTIDEYFRLTQKLRDLDSDFAITSDVIVGFPGESDSDFKKTLDLIEKIEFDNLFSFKYSDRKGTKASEMKGKLDEKTKSSRLKILQDLQKENTLVRNKRLEGKTVEILVDGISKLGTQYSGRTDTNKIVNFTSKKDIIGQLANVTIKRSFINSLQGELEIEN
ncbi:MAG: tRNA (N6-isopentenyl adenosine(37)-C2)-methylthiotransferase MiaB [Deltaproteobacteria bacterium]|nr:tRNA (N6-isopentenyl adenosine(37)-C2)-methylthiotransferase MiaB [Deltaproteobacteria bacterium]